MKTTTNTITSFDQLSLTLNATQVAAVLGISRSNAYALMRSEGFPTLHIGKRMLVPKDRLIRWIEANPDPLDRSQCFVRKCP